MDYDDVTPRNNRMKTDPAAGNRPRTRRRRAKRWTRRQGGDRLYQEADGAADSEGIALGADEVTGATVGAFDVVELDGEHAANVAPKAKMMRRRLIM